MNTALDIQVPLILLLASRKQKLKPTQGPRLLLAPMWALDVSGPSSENFIHYAKQF
jgi:hypothetical protein